MKEKVCHVWCSSNINSWPWRMEYNIYNDIFRINMAHGVHLVGYADEVLGIFVARNIEEAKRKVNQMIIRTRTIDSSLQRRKRNWYFLWGRVYRWKSTSCTTCDTTLTTRIVANYLSIRLGPTLTFWDQIWHAAIKAAKVTFLGSRLMVNIGGSAQSRQRMKIAITDSILL